eukprot:357102-Chlamydomonas_euryale.AAC.7
MHGSIRTSIGPATQGGGNESTGKDTIQGSDLGWLYLGKCAREGGKTGEGGVTMRQVDEGLGQVGLQIRSMMMCASKQQLTLLCCCHAFMQLAFAAAAALHG